ncbi:hypothetical protein CDAR_309591 [Caerostris darwini]|uniref:Uncharacterized protein n=1 Tax=Caerostris darwini TaxID=1538125 RepID=A0AAV4TDE3_9ARAC|nr:hypothetical protein CDAR_309591 [Caerostris darwini]
MTTNTTFLYISIFSTSISLIQLATENRSYPIPTRTLQNIISGVKSYTELNRNSSTELSTQKATRSLPSTRPYISTDLKWSPRALSQRHATGALELYDSEMDNCKSGLSRIRPAVLSQAFTTTC